MRVFACIALSLMSTAALANGALFLDVHPTDQAHSSPANVEIVARLPDLDPSGIAVIGNRLFLSFPKHDADHDGPVLGEWRDGRLVPFPDAAMASSTTADPAQRLVSVHGITTDARGRLWVVDDGKVHGQAIAPGGAKLVGFDPATGRVVAKVLITSALLPDSHLNDLRIDLTHGKEGTAYIADSSFDGHPALIVVDLASARQRRVLANDARIKADPGYQTVLEGRVLRQSAKPPAFPGGGVDGVALSADSSTLYFAALSSRRLYSLPTALLADFAQSDSALADAIVDLGEKGAADGMATDSWGRLYTTAADHDAIFRRNLDGNFEQVAQDPRFIWPDGIFADEHYVYVVLGQWTRLPQYHDGVDRRQPPYLVARVPISPP
ncbi:MULTISPECIES: L-dopachrome tautomerase-related protein [unclassified Pseudomonas]|uniref:L-dopachrome tautomerase-related protein n=1 Tax=unclassified Pseudomonas TaxID=196821 RepID=UPI00190533F0|nr:MULTISPECIES: L-dopachrome tautomerase-related protein [unclassified Pseudomonas]